MTCQQKQRRKDVMEIINKCDINDRKVRAKRGEWSKGKKTEMIHYFFVKHAE